MPRMWWVVGALAVAAVLSAYLTWTAGRVERLHVRAASAGRALDAHLLRRAAAAAVVAENTDFVELYAAARLALDAEPDEREAAENDLTRQLRRVRADRRRTRRPARWSATSRRVVLARQVHTDLVRDALPRAGGRWCACCGWRGTTSGPATSRSTTRPAGATAGGAPPGPGAPGPGRSGADLSVSAGVNRTATGVPRSALGGFGGGSRRGWHDPTRRSLSWDCRP